MNQFEINQEHATTLRAAVKSGSIDSASIAKLNEYMSWLCMPTAASSFGPAEYEQICEVVRLHMLRAHIHTLQERVTALNKKNNLTQHIVIALTVASIIGSAFQTWYGYKADRRSEAELVSTARAQPSRKSAESTPIQAQAQTSNQANPTPAASSSVVRPSGRKESK